MEEMLSPMEKLHKRIQEDIGQALRELVTEMKAIKADIRELPIEAVIICVSNPELIFLSEYLELENFIKTTAKDEIHRRSMKQFTSMSSGRIKRDPMYLGYLRKPTF